MSSFPDESGLDESRPGVADAVEALVGHSDEAYYQRGKARYVRAHAHLALSAAGGEFALDGIAARAVTLTALLYDELQRRFPDPSDSGAPPHVPAETTTPYRGQHPSASPAAPQSDSRPPRQRKHAQPIPPAVQEALQRGGMAVRRGADRLAVCQETCDPGAVEHYHRKLAETGLERCSACGARLDVATHSTPVQP